MKGNFVVGNLLPRIFFGYRCCLADEGYSKYYLVVRITFAPTIRLSVFNFCRIVWLFYYILYYRFSFLYWLYPSKLYIGKNFPYFIIILFTYICWAFVVIPSIFPKFTLIEFRGPTLAFKSPKHLNSFLIFASSKDSSQYFLCIKCILRR